ncbi:hypothetical protein FF38_11148 [Lucilia cuprina]|uniref:Chitin-binding type-2 domain-containing protein n=1 Tax=Lucilia cuprina TaxID=7375 RepID=A0A0L0BVU5_LUCCU|nr:hypothetical protein FF38_11148 [Lucilia cuprina]
MFKVSFYIMLLAGNLLNALALDICEDQVDGTRLAHPADCSRFIQCHNGETVAIRYCPFGLHFNRYESICDFKFRAGCDFSYALQLVGYDNGNKVDCEACQAKCGGGSPGTGVGPIRPGPGRPQGKPSTPCMTAPTPKPKPCSEEPPTPSPPTASPPTAPTPCSEETPTPSKPTASPPTQSPPTAPTPCPEEPPTPSPPTASPPTAPTPCSEEPPTPSKPTASPPTQSPPTAPTPCPEEKPTPSPPTASTPTASPPTAPTPCSTTTSTPHKPTPCPNKPTLPPPTPCPPSGGEGGSDNPQPQPPITGPSGISCANSGKCQGQRDGAIFADNSSSGFIVCQCQCEIKMPCPAGLIFNERLQVCDWPQS